MRRTLKITRGELFPRQKSSNQDLHESLYFGLNANSGSQVSGEGFIENINKYTRM
jgi:hypothetical protein